MENLNNNNEFALITGASSGIGYELAKIFAKNGINVILIARRRDNLEQLALLLNNEFKVKTHVMALDITEPETRFEIYKFVKVKQIFIKYLVNNAGSGLWGLFHKSDWETESKMISLNITALTHLSKLFVKEMVLKGTGKILNVCSIAGFYPEPFMAIYGATKSYVLSFSQALESELKGTGVKVTTLCPGPTQSGFHKVANGEDIKMAKKIKMASSESIAQAGYKVMMKGKSVFIPGRLIKTVIFFGRFVPRKFVTWLIKKFLSK